jgi:hypothetical protein
MQLTALLSTPGEPLEGASENPADGQSGAETVLPFAVMLSGALSVLAPAGDAQAPEGGLEQPLVPEGTPGPQPAIGEGQASARLGTTPAPVQLDSPQGLQPVSVESGSMETGVGLASEALSQTVTDETAPPPSSGAERIIKASAGPRASSETNAAAVVSADAEAAAPKPASSGAERIIKASAGPEASTETNAAALASPDASPVDAEAVPRQATAPDVARQGVRVADVSPAYREAGSVGAEEATPESSPDARPAASSKPTGRTAAVDRHAEAAPAAPAPAAKEGLPAEMKAAVAANTTPDHNTAPEPDAALPDPAGAPQEKETESSTGAETRTRATTVEDGHVSSDAGGEQGAREGRAGRSSRSRAARRAEAASDAPHKAEQRASETAQTPTARPPIAPQDPAMPEETGEAGATLTDPDPGSSVPKDQVASGAADKSSVEATTGGVRAGRGLFQQNRAVPVAWLRAVLNNARQAVFSEDGWKVLEMNLDDGEGTVTIKARREDGRVAVAVGFSDPELGALASANADRLQEALQAEYEATVDFSLFNGQGDADGSGKQKQARRAGASVGGASRVDADGLNDAPGRRSLLPGGRHEWVG